MRDFQVIIVGGGLAGPLLASGLLELGVKVDVYEKLELNSKRDGYAIRVAQPCLYAFRQCLSAEQYSKIMSRMGRFDVNEETTPIWYDHMMNPLLNAGRLSSQFHGSAPIDRVVLRNTIMERPLREGIVHHGKSFDRYEIIKSEGGDERVRVWFKDSSSADCDILIGADGSHSKINSQIGLNNIRQVQLIAFITKAQLSKEKLHRLPASARSAPILCFSHRKTYFCVAYLPKSSQKSADGTNDSNGVSDFDDEAATFTLSMMLPTSDCPPDIMGWDSAKQWQFLSDSISDWNEEFREIIDIVRAEDLYTFRPRAAIRPALNWRTKVRSSKDPNLGHPRVWLLGDAMHVMLPHRGMGGNQAMLDTTVLLPLLQQLDKFAKTSGRVSEDAVLSACAEYENEMIPRTFEWVEASGGVKQVLFDTNTITGRLTVWYLLFSLNVRDMWNALCQVLRWKNKTS